jgi:glyoxylase-like metal-dependent hydrolase (beta-lactamase superfamily II)
MTLPAGEPNLTEVAEVYALRYATMRGRRASEIFLRYPGPGVADRPLAMDCYFWLVRTRSQVVLVDCGWNRDRGLRGSGSRFSHVQTEERDPVELLARLGVSPADVDHVVASHMHFDHVGNLDLFPNATLSLALAEFDCWTGQYRDRPAIAHSTAAEDVQVIRDWNRAGRVQLVENSREVVPGVIATPVGGHTPGQMIVEVAAPACTVVLASDAAHYHEELDHDRPFYIYSDMIALLGTYDLLRAKAAQPDTWVVAGHDPVEMGRFERVNADCVDLTKPVT